MFHSLIRRTLLPADIQLKGSAGGVEAIAAARTFTPTIEVHYDGAKDGDVVLEIVGMGPETLTPAEE